MAKKKNSQFLPGLLEDIMSLLTPEEQEIAFELFNDGANQVDEELSHIYYLIEGSVSFFSFSATSRMKAFSSIFR